MLCTIRVSCHTLCFCELHTGFTVISVTCNHLLEWIQDCCWRRQLWRWDIHLSKVTSLRSEKCILEWISHVFRHFPKFLSIFEIEEKRDIWQILCTYVNYVTLFSTLLYALNFFFNFFRIFIWMKNTDLWFYYYFFKIMFKANFLGFSILYFCLKIDGVILYNF